ncbi:MAG: sialidase family protein [Pirellulales bacterium]
MHDLNRRAALQGLGALTTAALLGQVARGAEEEGEAAAARAGHFSAELIFPLHPQHNHAPGIAELPDGQLLVSWYRGSGERKADDVAVYGSRAAKGSAEWSEPFVMVDTPGFPDGNTCLMVDSRDRLWLFWPLVLANTWESCLTQACVSTDYLGAGSPHWQRQSNVLLKPKDFGQAVERVLDAGLPVTPLPDEVRRELEGLRSKLGDRLYQRLGWQPRCKPTVLPSGRILLPLYTDTFSISIMAISDDLGETWMASEPLVGWGNIQPTVLRRDDGTLVAYMRENGVTNRIRVSESRDDGMTWGPVGISDLPNPGAGIDGVRLANGHWLLVYNDTTDGRNSLAVSISEDEGRTWRWTRHLEHEPEGSYHYPTVIQGRDGTIHAVYSYFVSGGKSMKHAAFDEAWVQAAS